MDRITAWMTVGPLLMGVLAAGVVVLIKVTRRRQGTLDPRQTDAVPVNPLSQRDGEKMLWRYFFVLSAATLFAVVILALAH